MKMVWENKIKDALIAKGVSEKDAVELVNGIIDDAIEDERSDASCIGYAQGLSYSCACDDI